MSKVFFDHLIVLDEVLSELDRYLIDEEEKVELLALVDETIHHHTLNVIFNHLPKDKHAEFVERLKLAPHDLKLLEYLKSEMQVDIESEIKKQADRVKKEILLEIKKSKKR